MTVPAVGAPSLAGTQTTTATKNAASTNGTLDYNAFLTLLVAQLKNQDPTSPADPTTFVSQLASFSAVEQQVNMNSKLDSLLTESAISQAGALVGRTITSADGSVSGQIASVQVTSSGLQAILANGQSVSVGSGITVS